MLYSSVVSRRVVSSGSLAIRKLATTACTADGLIYDGTSYPYRWLRDSCQCSHCVHPSTRQKLHRTTDIPRSIHPNPEGVQYTKDGVSITWPSGHRSSYSAAFLHAYASPASLQRFHRDVKPFTWDKGIISAMPSLFISYTDLEQPSGLLSAVTQLTRYGLLFVTGVSNQETSNETCEARKLARAFGEIRTTFYGELWDVINVRNSKNIAYTNLHLGLHMDLLYCHHPPRFQLLHCLRNRVEGGTSVFVDALHAAERLRESHPADFSLLATTRVPYHYINDGNHLHYSHPIIELEHNDANDSAFTPVKFVNYSPPFQAPFPPSTSPAFYAAFERFVSYLENSTFRYQYTLQEGDAVLFDNRRVLHARTAFTDPSEGGLTASKTETNRWLKGCYFEADTPFSRGRVLRERLGVE